VGRHIRHVVYASLLHFGGSRRLHGLGLQQRRLHGDKAGVAQPRRLA
jgi:hypothetical protein